ncbi:MAG: hypothetical protein FD145_618 [Candidatus Saganbacteria bacterium]|uniref:GyrI-like small molecule binding domain-containing protein n=1 Tax=Candidatus Saganbacteria bacterium TaxID=2575572 RepID=A0A833L1A0_UNCSA|nr:MAG: hypothetical protein FD145_618 [Candidatus Saganbacteria bacterium]
MKALKIVSIVIAIIAVALVGMAFYMGLFSTLKISEIKTEPMTIVYEEFIGPYSETGKVFGNLYKTLKTEKIETSRGLGIYFSDPKTTPPEKQKSQCGAILGKEQLKMIPEIAKKHKIKTIPQMKALATELPIKNVLSYMIGPMKAYPALMKYAQEKGYKTALAMELYDMRKNVIIYLLEIKK